MSEQKVRFSDIVILGLVAVSAIPFLVSTISWHEGIPLKEMIYDLPRLVFGILPLYIPVLWIAYSSNKRLNLSKRLIEEYTHKEVLSKTFEGLSSQIENIEDEEISNELRVKLLYNIISVSSENPGKLITNYNNSDHPLTEALERSTQLANAVDKLSTIHGLGSLTRFLDKRAEVIFEEASEQVQKGLMSLKQNNIDENKDV
jgi:hypothetical protein